MSVRVGSNASPASDSHGLVSGCLSPFAWLETGCLSSSLSYVRSVMLVCTGCGRSMTMSRCKLTSHPLYVGMPLEDCLLLAGKNCNRPMGLNVLGKNYVNIPSGKYIYVHIYVCICVYTYLCKMDERRSFASWS